MKLTKILSGIAAILLVGSSLNAETSNSTQTLAVGSSANFTLGKFNTGLGTLTGVELTIYSVEQGYAYVSNTSTTNTATVKNLTDSLYVKSLQLDQTEYNGLPKYFATTPPTSGAGNSLLPSSSRNYYVSGNQSVANETFVISSEYWSAYSGSGSVFFDANNSASISVSGATFFGDNTNVTANTTLTLKYTYDAGPVPVPEASTVIVQLLIVAGGVWMFVRRRRAAAVRA
jgi:hypothetical protein